MAKTALKHPRNYSEHLGFNVANKLQSKAPKTFAKLKDIGETATLRKWFFQDAVEAKKKFVKGKAELIKGKTGLIRDNLLERLGQAKDGLLYKKKLIQDIFKDPEQYKRVTGYGKKGTSADFIVNTAAYTKKQLRALEEKFPNIFAAGRRATNTLSDLAISATNKKKDLSETATLLGLEGQTKFKNLKSIVASKANNLKSAAKNIPGLRNLRGLDYALADSKAARKLMGFTNNLDNFVLKGKNRYRKLKWGTEAVLDKGLSKVLGEQSARQTLKSGSYMYRLKEDPAAFLEEVYHNPNIRGKLATGRKFVTTNLDKVKATGFYNSLVENSNKGIKFTGEYARKAAGRTLDLFSKRTSLDKIKYGKNWEETLSDSNAFRNVIRDNKTLNYLKGTNTYRSITDTLGTLRSATPSKEAIIGRVKSLHTVDHLKALHPITGLKAFKNLNKKEYLHKTVIDQLEKHFSSGTRSSLDKLKYGKDWAETLSDPNALKTLATDVYRGGKSKVLNRVHNVTDKLHEGVGSFASKLQKDFKTIRLAKPSGSYIGAAGKALSNTVTDSTSTILGKGSSLLGKTVDKVKTNGLYQDLSRVSSDAKNLVATHYNNKVGALTELVNKRIEASPKLLTLKSNIGLVKDAVDAVGAKKTAAMLADAYRLKYTASIKNSVGNLVDKVKNVRTAAIDTVKGTKLYKDAAISAGMAQEGASALKQFGSNELEALKSTGLYRRGKQIISIPKKAYRVVTAPMRVTKNFVGKALEGTDLEKAIQAKKKAVAKSIAEKKAYVKGIPSRMLNKTTERLGKAANWTVDKAAGAMGTVASSPVLAYGKARDALAKGKSVVSSVRDSAAMFRKDPKKWVGYTLDELKSSREARALKKAEEAAKAPKVAGKVARLKSVLRQRVGKKITNTSLYKASADQVNAIKAGVSGGVKALKSSEAYTGVVSTITDRKKQISEAIGKAADVIKNPETYSKALNKAPYRKANVVAKLANRQAKRIVRGAIGATKVGIGGAKSVASKQVAKIAATRGGKALAKVGGKMGIKKIPVLGILMGLGFGLHRALKGDFVGAGLEVLSGILGGGNFFGLGTLASFGIDAALMAKDAHDAKTKAEKNAANAEGAAKVVKTAYHLSPKTILKAKGLASGGWAGKAAHYKKDFATGGEIKGMPGTTTSDDVVMQGVPDGTYVIPGKYNNQRTKNYIKDAQSYSTGGSTEGNTIRVSNGEYLIDPDTASKIGPRNLEKLRTGKVPDHPRFDDGGNVGDTIIVKDPTNVERTAQVVASASAATLSKYATKSTEDKTRIASLDPAAAKESAEIKKLVLNNPDAAQKVYDNLQKKPEDKPVVQDTKQESQVLSNDKERIKTLSDLQEIEKQSVDTDEKLAKARAKAAKEAHEMVLARDFKKQLDEMTEAIKESQFATEVKRVMKTGRGAFAGQTQARDLNINNTKTSDLDTQSLFQLVSSRNGSASNKNSALNKYNKTSDDIAAASTKLDTYIAKRNDAAAAGDIESQKHYEDAIKSTQKELEELTKKQEDYGTELLKAMQPTAAAQRVFKNFEQGILNISKVAADATYSFDNMVSGVQGAVTGLRLMPTSTENLSSEQYMWKNSSSDVRNLMQAYKVGSNTYDNLTQEQSQILSKQAAAKSELKQAPKGFFFRSAEYKRAKDALDDLNRQYDENANKLQNVGEKLRDFNDVLVPLKAVSDAAQKFEQSMHSLNSSLTMTSLGFDDLKKQTDNFYGGGGIDAPVFLTAKQQRDALSAGVKLTPGKSTQWDVKYADLFSQLMNSSDRKQRYEISRQINEIPAEREAKKQQQEQLKLIDMQREHVAPMTEYATSLASLEAEFEKKAATAAYSDNPEEAKGYSDKAKTFEDAILKIRDIIGTSNSQFANGTVTADTVATNMKDFKTVMDDLQNALGKDAKDLLGHANFASADDSLKELMKQTALLQLIATKEDTIKAAQKELGVSDSTNLAEVLHLDGHKSGGAIGTMIKGPGTGTSDSIPMMLREGSYVIKERQAKKAFNMLNNSGVSVANGTSGNSMPVKVSNGEMVLSPEEVSAIGGTSAAEALNNGTAKFANGGGVFDSLSKTTDKGVKALEGYRLGKADAAISGGPLNWLGQSALMGGAATLEMGARLGKNLLIDPLSVIESASSYQAEHGTAKALERGKEKVSDIISNLSLANVKAAATNDISKGGLGISSGIVSAIMAGGMKKGLNLDGFNPLTNQSGRIGVGAASRKLTGYLEESKHTMGVSVNMSKYIKEISKDSELAKEVVERGSKPFGKTMSLNELATRTGPVNMKNLVETVATPTTTPKQGRALTGFLKDSQKTMGTSVDINRYVKEIAKNKDLLNAVLAKGKDVYGTDSLTKLAIKAGPVNLKGLVDSLEVSGFSEGGNVITKKDMLNDPAFINLIGNIDTSKLDKTTVSSANFEAFRGALADVVSKNPKLLKYIRGIQFNTNGNYQGATGHDFNSEDPRSDLYFNVDNLFNHPLSSSYGLGASAYDQLAPTIAHETTHVRDFALTTLNLEEREKWAKAVPLAKKYQTTYIKNLIKRYHNDWEKHPEDRDEAGLHTLVVDEMLAETGRLYYQHGYPGNLYDNANPSALKAILTGTYVPPTALVPKNKKPAPKLIKSGAVTPNINSKSIAVDPKLMGPSSNISPLSFDGANGLDFSSFNKGTATPFEVLKKHLKQQPFAFGVNVPDQLPAVTLPNGLDFSSFNKGTATPASVNTSKHNKLSDQDSLPIPEDKYISQVVAKNTTKSKKDWIKHLDGAAIKATNTDGLEVSYANYADFKKQTAAMPGTLNGVYINNADGGMEKYRREHTSPSELKRQYKQDLFNTLSRATDKDIPQILKRFNLNSEDDLKTVLHDNFSAGDLKYLGERHAATMKGQYVNINGRIQWQAGPGQVNAGELKEVAWKNTRPLIASSTSTASEGQVNRYVRNYSTQKAQVAPTLAKHIVLNPQVNANTNKRLHKPDDDNIWAIYKRHPDDFYDMMQSAGISVETADAAVARKKKQIADNIGKENRVVVRDENTPMRSISDYANKSSKSGMHSPHMFPVDAPVPQDTATPHTTLKDRSDAYRNGSNKAIAGLAGHKSNTKSMSFTDQLANAAKFFALINRVPISHKKSGTKSTSFTDSIASTANTLLSLKFPAFDRRKSDTELSSSTNPADTVNKRYFRDLSSVDKSDTESSGFISQLANAAKYTSWLKLHAVGKDRSNPIAKLISNLWGPKSSTPKKVKETPPTNSLSVQKKVDNARKQIVTSPQTTTSPDDLMQSFINGTISTGEVDQLVNFSENSSSGDLKDLLSKYNNGKLSKEEINRLVKTLGKRKLELQNELKVERSKLEGDYGVYGTDTSIDQHEKNVSEYENQIKILNGMLSGPTAAAIGADTGFTKGREYKQLHPKYGAERQGTSPRLQKSDYDIFVDDFNKFDTSMKQKGQLEKHFGERSGLAQRSIDIIRRDMQILEKNPQGPGAFRYNKEMAKVYAQMMDEWTHLTPAAIDDRDTTIQAAVRKNVGAAEYIANQQRANRSFPTLKWPEKEGKKSTTLKQYADILKTGADKYTTGNNKPKSLWEAKANADYSMWKDSPALKRQSPKEFRAGLSATETGIIEKGTAWVKSLSSAATDKISDLIKRYLTGMGISSSSFLPHETITDNNNSAPVKHNGGTIPFTGTYFMQGGEVVLPKAFTKGGQVLPGDKLSMTTSSTPKIDVSALLDAVDDLNSTIDKLTSINIEVNTKELPTIKVATDDLPTVKVSTEGLPVIKVDTSDLPTIKVSTDDLPMIKVDATDLPSLKVDANNLPKIKVDTTDLPTIKVDSVNLPTIKVDTSNVPDSIKVSGGSVGADSGSALADTIRDIDSRILKLEESDTDYTFMNGLNSELADIRKEINEVSSDNGSFESKLSALRSDVNESINTLTTETYKMKSYMYSLRG